MMKFLSTSAVECATRPQLSLHRPVMVDLIINYCCCGLFDDEFLLNVKKKNQNAFPLHSKQFVALSGWLLFSPPYPLNNQMCLRQCHTICSTVASTPGWLLSYIHTLWFPYTNWFKYATQATGQRECARYLSLLGTELRAILWLRGVKLSRWKMHS